MKLYNVFSLGIGVFAASNICLGQCMSDREKENLKGQVKQVQWIGSSSQNGISEKDFIESYYYNQKGDLENYSYAGKADGFVPKKIDYEKDKIGNIISEKRYDSSGELAYHLIFKYDSIGNEIASRLYHKLTLESYSESSYNTKCQLTEYKLFMPDSSLWLWNTYSYDNNGNLIQTTDELELFVTKSVFDLLGNELETVEYDMEGEIYSSKYYEYVTDPRGNWIRKLSYENDELFWIDEREISYY
jgi:hypothetical protein